MIYTSFMSACVGVGLFWASLGSASAACEQVTFSDVGWTDITATTAVSSVILDTLETETDLKLMSVPVTYASLAKGDIDVFLGNWMPLANQLTHLHLQLCLSFMNMMGR